MAIGASHAVITRVCMFCGSSFSWTVPMNHVRNWLAGADIEEAFDLPPDDIAIIKTQVCGTCAREHHNEE